MKDTSAVVTAARRLAERQGGIANSTLLSQRFEISHRGIVEIYRVKVERIGQRIDETIATARSNPQ